MATVTLQVTARYDRWVTTHENSVMMWSFKEQIFKRSVIPNGNEKEWWASHYGVVYKLNSTAQSLSRRGLNLLAVVRPVEQAHWLLWELVVF